MVRSRTKRKSAKAFRSSSRGQPLFLGIESGGTRTTAIVATMDDVLLQQIQGGPGNMKLMTDAELVALFREIREKSSPVLSVGIGMAGVRDARDEARILKAAAQVWPEIPCAAAHDLEIALRAATFGKEEALPALIVLSGTGSCCYGRNRAGLTAKVGGWGHIIGDKGSGYEIGLRALKAVVFYFDRDGVWSALGERILRELQLNEPNELIEWVQQARKNEVAALAVPVFDLWKQQDKIAADILQGAASTLAKDALICARRLVEPNPRFIFAGSVLTRQPQFAELAASKIKAGQPSADISVLDREGAWGAVYLGRDWWRQMKSPLPVDSPAKPKKERPPFYELPESFRSSPTEQRHPKSMSLSVMAIEKAIELMLREDSRIPEILLHHRDDIARLTRWIADAFQKKGRLFYAGAGTSGRLGILDASECPPTFRVPPEMVQGIIAGGQRAIWQAVEGAEDDAAAGERAVQFRGVRKNDVFIGIAASGRTPFVWGGLKAARALGAKTALLCFNPSLKIPRHFRPHLVLAPNLGPEILTGSTRLKAGTATKLLLNIFTTLAMVQIGKVDGNLMIDLNPSNLKLRDRAVRIVRELTGCDAATATATLEASEWVVKRALEKLRTKPRRKAELIREDRRPVS